MQIKEAAKTPNYTWNHPLLIFIYPRFIVAHVCFWEVTKLFSGAPKMASVLRLVSLVNHRNKVCSNYDAPIFHLVLQGERKPAILPCLDLQNCMCWGLLSTQANIQAPCKHCMQKE